MFEFMWHAENKLERELQYVCSLESNSASISDIESASCRMNWLVDFEWWQDLKHVRLHLQSHSADSVQIQIWYMLLTQFKRFAMHDSFFCSEVIILSFVRPFCHKSSRNTAAPRNAKYAGLTQQNLDICVMLAWKTKALTSNQCCLRVWMCSMFISSMAVHWRLRVYSSSATKPVAQHIHVHVTSKRANLFKSEHCIQTAEGRLKQLALAYQSLETCIPHTQSSQRRSKQSRPNIQSNHKNAERSTHGNPDEQNKFNIIILWSTALCQTTYRPKPFDITINLISMAIHTCPFFHECDTAIENARIDLGLGFGKWWTRSTHLICFLQIISSGSSKSTLQLIRSQWNT